MGALAQTTGRQVAAQDGQAAVEHTQYLTFMLGGEMFAIGILCIKEIIDYGGLTEEIGALAHIGNSESVAAA